MSGEPTSRARRAYQRVLPEAVRRPLHRWRRQAAGPARRARWSLTDPAIRRSRARLEDLRGLHRGQRCVVMGNGPSLNEMDLEHFAGEHVWMSNRAYLLLDRISWRPSHWVAVDRRVVPDIADELIDVQRRLPQTRFFYPDHFRFSGTLPSLPNTWWFREGPWNEDDVPWGTFTRDAAVHVSPVRTVTITAIQLAIHLGFDPIYLIGCDTTYSIPDTVREEASDTGVVGLRSIRDDDANHFDPRYFGAGRAWHAPHPERMQQHYAYVRQAADELGVTIMNATVGGALEAFPRVDYRELFA